MDETVSLPWEPMVYDGVGSGWDNVGTYTVLELFKALIWGVSHDF